MFVFLPDSPGKIDATHVLDGENAHGHAEIQKRPIHLGRSCAFFHEEVRLSHVRKHHAIAHKAPAVADNDSHLF